MPSVRDIRQLFERWAYPELARIAPHHRERAMARARNEPLEFLEIGGILTALFVVTVSTRYGLKDPMLADRLTAALANFIVAVPLILVLVGPFLIRRMRRGLRAFIQEQRHSPQQ